MTKKILITGANRGIGLALVKQAISLNFSVLACYRDENNSKELFSIKSNQLSFIKLDVTKKSDFELVKNSIATDLDYLICNAGVSNGYGTFLNEDHDFESIEKVFKINVIGSLMTARYLSTNVIKGGKIIFISSKMGVQKHEGAIATAYRASKAALNNIMISISNELKFKGIIVTAFHPGWVRTDMGGSNATLSAEESASNLIYNFLKLKIDDTGSFFNYNGKLLNF